MRKCKVCEATEMDAEFYASVKTYCKETKSNALCRFYESVYRVERL